MEVRQRNTPDRPAGGPVINEEGVIPVGVQVGRQAVGGGRDDLEGERALQLLWSDDAAGLVIDVHCPHQAGVPV
jgi:hypothetical protein